MEIARSIKNVRVEVVFAATIASLAPAKGSESEELSSYSIEYWVTDEHGRRARLDLDEADFFRKIGEHADDPAHQRQLFRLLSEFARRAKRSEFMDDPAEV